jgi:broad specificity phosphatase PhoE
MKHLYFIRHGLSVMNKQGIFSGSSNDTPLDIEGIKQCHEASKIIIALNIDAIVSSPMIRAIESATIIAKEIDFPKEKIITSDLLVERNFGPLEGTQYTQKINLEQIIGVELNSSLINRAKAALKLINELDANTVLVVSHGAMGKALTNAINPSIDYRDIPGFNNAEVIKLI